MAPAGLPAGRAIPCKERPTRTLRKIFVDDLRPAELARGFARAIDKDFAEGCPDAVPFKDFWARAPEHLLQAVVTFDDKKSKANVAARGLSFERAEDFDWSMAVIEYDRRRDYGEPRFRAYGFLDDRLHALVFTHRDDDLRVISLRRANRREQAAYAKQTGSLPHR